MPLSEESPVAGEGSGSGSGEIILFGVRVKVDPMRKSVSMNNLSEYEPASNPVEDGARVLPEGGVAAGYASADDVAPQPSGGGGGERKRGTPWTEEEHKLFLIGLQKVGKGDWRGISRNYVKTRTPTQVASHAQKYFLRRTNVNRRRRRSSLFDITTDSVAASMPAEEFRSNQDIRAQPVAKPAASLPPPVPSNVNYFSTMPFPMTVRGPLYVSMGGGNPSMNSPHAQNYLVNNNNTSSPMEVHYVPVLSMHPPSSAMADLNLNQRPPGPSPLSLRLSLSNNTQNQSSYRNGDSSVSVA